MNAPQGGEPLLIEALRAERYARHAGRPVFAKRAAFDGPRVRLQSHLEVVREAELAARRGEQLGDRLRCKQARRAAAEEDAVHFAPGDPRRLCLEIAYQPLQVRAVRQLAVQRVGIEIAVRALAHAPGKVHVKRERWNQETGHDATITPETPVIRDSFGLQPAAAASG